MANNKNLYYEVLKEYENMHGKGSFTKDGIALEVIEAEKAIRSVAKGGTDYFLDPALRDPATGVTIEKIVYLATVLRGKHTVSDSEREQALASLAGNQTLRERVAAYYNHMNIVPGRFESDYGHEINARLFKNPQNYAPQGYLTYLSADSFSERSLSELNNFWCNRLKENGDVKYWEKIVKMAANFQEVSGFFFLFREGYRQAQKDAVHLAIDERLNQDMKKVYNFLKNDTEAYGHNLVGGMVHANRQPFFRRK